MKKEINSSFRVRFAPAPTGYLHIGGLRTALFNWLFAKHMHATFLIRVEDTDTQRSSTDFMHAQLAALKWAGIEPDEPVVIQSSRLKEHQDTVHRLFTQGKAYPCWCTTQDVADRTGTRQIDGELVVRYDQKCREKKYTADDLQKPHVIRFKIPDDIQEVVFDDLIRGEIRVGVEHLDDFIISRSDGRPIYNLVVVVDDAFMKITHIIRGEDHISNTPKQILLYRACGYEIPQFAHLPLILGTSGNKLSKRDAAVSVDEYRLAGFLPDALINYLARLGWSHGDQEIFTREELISYFSLDHVGKKGSVFDVEKLLWVNSVYLQACNATELIDHLKKDIDVVIEQRFSQWTMQQLIAAVDLYKDRIKTIRELRDALQQLHDGLYQWNQQEIILLGDLQKSAHILHHVALRLKMHDVITHEIVQTELKQLAKELAISLQDIARPVRLALTGTVSGAGIFALLLLIGKQESIDRIERFRSFITKN